MPPRPEPRWMSSVINAVLRTPTGRTRRSLFSQNEEARKRARHRDLQLTRPEFRSCPTTRQLRAFGQMATAGSSFPSLSGKNAMPTMVVRGTRLTGVSWNPHLHPPLRNKTGQRHWSSEESVACHLGSCRCHLAALPGALHVVQIFQVSGLVTSIPDEGSSAASLGDFIWK